MNYSVKREIYTVELKNIIKANHYTQSAPSAIKYCFTLRNENQEIVGILLYGFFSRMQAQRKYENYLELSRLWVADSEPKNTESFFIGKTLRFLQIYSQLIGVVSYADPTVGHSGTVYKATNFTLFGETRKSYHYQKGDDIVHKKRVWREAKALSISEKKHAENLGLQKREEEKKLVFRYLFKRKTRDAGYVYIFIFPNGKVYIGKTLNTLDSREARHLSDARNGSPLRFHAALRKYEYKYEKKILETVPAESLLEQEQYWIKFYDSENKDKGYNDPYAPLGSLDAVPESVLFEAFELRKKECSYEEISERLGLSRDYINAIINGRSRPEIRLKWLETNSHLTKQKTIDDNIVLNIFASHDAGKTLTEVAEEFGVTKTYVSYLFNGKMRSDLKDEYERITNKPFCYVDSHSVNKEVARKILESKYKKGEEKTCVQLAEEFGLNIHQVRTIVTGKTANDVFEEFKKENVVDEKNFKYIDTQLLKAFDLRFKEKEAQKDVAKEFNISKSFLSMLFNGESRPDIKQKWENENGKIPSLTEIKSEAAKKWRSKQK